MDFLPFVPRGLVGPPNGWSEALAKAAELSPEAGERLAQALDRPYSPAPAPSPEAELRAAEAGERARRAAHIEALKRERAGYIARGLADRVAACDEALAALENEGR